MGTFGSSSVLRLPTHWLGIKIPNHYYKMWITTSYVSYSFLQISTNPANIRFDEDVLKTSFIFIFRRRLQDVFIKTNIHFTHASSEDVLIKTNILVLVILPQDVFKMSSRRLQDVLKAYCQDVFKTSSRHLQDVLKNFYVFKTSSIYLQDVFKTFSRRIIKLNCSC